MTTLPETSETAEEAIEEIAVRPGRSALREIIETVVLTLIIFFAVRSMVQNFKVEGSSMEPSLRHGQYLLVNKLAYLSIDPVGLRSQIPLLPELISGRRYLLGTPQKGDVVVFHFPKDPTRDFIKRIIGTPGDQVEVRGSHVFLNGQQLDEPYLREEPRYNVPAQSVPSGQYFVLGDNRNNSSDSHVWGMVPEENLLGKAWLVYWPLTAWGVAPNYTLAAEP